MPDGGGTRVDSLARRKTFRRRHFLMTPHGLATFAPFQRRSENPQHRMLRHGQKNALHTMRGACHTSAHFAAPAHR